MRNWLLAATVLTLVGCLIFAGVMTTLGWDFTKLSTMNMETNEHKVIQNFQNISVMTDTADVTIVPAESDETKVICTEREKVQHTVTVQDGTLMVELVDTRAWYEYIGIVFDTPKITVYLPAGAYEDLSVHTSTGDTHISDHLTFKNMTVSQSTGDVTNRAAVSGTAKITTDTGDICVENTSADTMVLTVSTGDVSVEEVKCRAFTSVGDTGDITLENTLVAGKLYIERSTGDVQFDDCDAAELLIVTDTGDVRGSLLTPKLFNAQTDTGKVDVPKSAEGGSCEVVTDTGDICLTLAQYAAGTIIR